MHNSEHTKCHGLVCVSGAAWYVNHTSRKLKNFVVIQGHTVATTYPEQVREGMKGFFLTLEILFIWCALV